MAKLILDEEDLKDEYVPPVEINKAVVETIKEELNIPSNYITVNLISNGKLEKMGVPKTLHFRNYTGHEALQINSSDEYDRMKNICNVLTQMNYEHYNCLNLTVEDITYILMRIHGAFIGRTIEQQCYIDETIEDDRKLNNKANITTVDVNIGTIPIQILGKDINDIDLPVQVKAPFTLTDKITGDKFTFKIATIADTIIANKYCKQLNAENAIKYAKIKMTLQKLENDPSDKLFNFMCEHEDECKEYYQYMQNYVTQVAEITQALQITSINGEDISQDIEKQWDAYQNKVSASMWLAYSKVMKQFQYGLQNRVKVFSEVLGGAPVERTFQFQPFDFLLHINNKQADDTIECTFD